MRLNLWPPYALELQISPFSFAVWRGDQRIIQSAPYPGMVRSYEITGPRICMAFDDATLILETNETDISIRWDSAGVVTNSFPLDGRWYGQGELINQPWPLSRAMIPRSDFSTIDNGPTGLSCILSPVWLSEHGVAITARSQVKISLNAPPGDAPQNAWSLGTEQAPFKDRPRLDTGREGDGLLTLSGESLSYDIVFGEDIIDAHRGLTSRIGHCSDVPPEPVIREPIWNTWARHHAEINHERVREYAQEIVAHGYPAGRFVIDDRWQTQYGDLHFDPVRFPDPAGLIRALHEMGFTAHTWVVPFFSPKSDAYQEGVSNGFLVQAQDGSPSSITWWQGIGGLLDVTNPAALAWFLDNLHALQAETGLDGFKFDAGEACFLPAGAKTYEPISPNEFTHRYIDFVGAHFPWSDVRSGWLNSRSPLLFRQWDKASGWGLDNGLHSVITGALSLSLSGYPLFLPDMIGGNAYTNQPDAELMIRWAQVNELMPGVQFSLAPWDYGDECSRLCLATLTLRETLMPQIIEAVRGASLHGEPAIRPIFWNSPHDQAALGCDDEFLLGNTLLAAPVIAPGQRQRDIYLPEGRWEGYWSGQEHTGPTLLRDYPAPLDCLPLFWKKQA